ncbi:Acyl-coenzyme A:6-aminopenicillanic acid acyl-transferase [Chitinophaga sp. CF118]|nr:Acyl-coenzyme A:6-aminopenicillanic acid acyl-transferase [Chitinophaga sp. CF118]
MEVQLCGSYFEMGEQHGAILKDEINAFLNDGLFQINELSCKPINKNNIHVYVEVYKEMIQLHLPEVYEEITGLAQGAAITIDEAILLQVRREIIGIGSFTLLGDCSSFGIHKPGNIVTAQTIDLNGRMTSLGHVIRWRPTNKDNLEVLQYSFAGLLGYAGMNNRGLAITINLVVSDGWKAGIPPYLLVRKFLECNTINECIDLIEEIPIASSRSFIIQDKERQIILEVTPTQHRIIESGILLHTNHYLHEELLHLDKLNIFSKNSSIKRLNILKSHLNEQSGLEDIVSIFKDHSVFPVGICAHNEDNSKSNETVASVIMYPEKQHFYALRGKPCQNNYNLYSF